MPSLGTSLTTLTNHYYVATVNCACTTHEVKWDLEFTYYVVLCSTQQYYILEYYIVRSRLSIERATWCHNTTVGLVYIKAVRERSTAQHQPQSASTNHNQLPPKSSELLLLLQAANALQAFENEHRPSACHRRNNRNKYV